MCLSRPGSISGQFDASESTQTRYLKIRNFFIPFELDVGQSGVKRLQLFVAENGGNWMADAVSEPDKRGFDFSTRRDGTYLFAVQAEYTDGSREPPRAQDLRAMLRVVIDTTPPTISVRARRGEPGTGGIEWDARDENLDPASIQLEGRWPGQSNWQPIPGSWRTSGDHYFQLKPGQRYQVRVITRDLAGNVGTSPVAVTPPSADDDPLDTGPSRRVDDGYAPGASVGGGLRPDVIDLNKTTITLRPQIEVGKSGIGKLKLFVTNDQGKTWEEVRDPKHAPPRGGDIVAGSQTGTRIETHQLTYEAPSDGLYGFAIVAESTVGLSNPIPQRGDPPDILVQVDTKAPTVRFTGVQVLPAGEGGNRVVVNWNITDENLARGKIVLSYAPRKDAPDDQWKEIAGGLDNTGRYDWMVGSGPDQPYQFYVRLKAEDRAGNTTKVVYENDVIVDLFKPKTIKIAIP